MNKLEFYAFLNFFWNKMFYDDSLLVLNLEILV